MLSLSLKTLRLKKRHTVPAMIGIDFGMHSIKALALSKTAVGYRLDAMASIATPKGGMRDHQLQDIPQVVQALKQLRQVLAQPYMDVATAVTGSSVTTKIISVPGKLTPELLAFHMAQEAQQHLSFSLDDISLDYELLGPSAHAPERDSVLLSAARTDYIQARVSALQQAGWRTQVVDIGSHALARAVRFLLMHTSADGASVSLPPEQLGAVLDVGADNLTFIVLERGAVIHSRLQPLPSACTDSSHVEHVIQQVRRNIQLFCSSSGHAQPAWLFLCGGGSLLPGLAVSLTQTLGLTVMPVDFSQVFGGKTSDYPDAAAYGTALGLALRCVSPCPI